LKLPNFLESKPLNDLRKALKADLSTFTGLPENVPTHSELEQLSTGRLEVSIDDVQILSDKTLSYKGRRILLHIRDMRSSSVKFHFAQCVTLDDMYSAGRYNRYVISEKMDGKFLVRRGESDSQARYEPLDVCKNCLLKVHWDGYVSHDNAKSMKIAQDFTVKKFFDKYSSSKITLMPKYKDTQMPVNRYADNFNEISNRFRASKNWTCEQCSFKAVSQEQKASLHTHHINGLKFDNALANLKCLCESCHAQQPYHGHMISAFPSTKGRYNKAMYRKKKRKWK
jgi:hypothetical protein